MIESYLIHLAILMCIYLLLSVSLNLAVGYTGLVNFGHIALFGIGAYASALLVKAGMPFLISILAAGGLAAIFGYVLVLAVKKLKGDYLALSTLGFGFVVYSLMVNLSDVTGGPLGISGIPRPNLFGLAIKSNAAFLILAATIGVIAFIVLLVMVKSPFGRLLEATRDDEVGLRVLGKDTFTLKCKALMVSGFFAGVAGCLYSQYMGFIDPSAFYMDPVILVFTIIIVGGIASLVGTLIGTVIIVLLPEVLRFTHLQAALLGPGRLILYALILLLILILRPRGILGRVDIR